MKKQILYGALGCSFLLAWLGVLPRHQVEASDQAGTVSALDSAHAVAFVGLDTNKDDEVVAGAHAWSSRDFEQASRDPFVPGTMAPTPPPAPVSETSSSSVAMAPAAPPPVPMPFRFLGYMDTPAGEHVVYLTGVGESPVSAKINEPLEGGWFVEAIDVEGVRVVHLETQQRAWIGVPPTP